MTISNAEKQARFRRKEELKKFANLVFREWQVIADGGRANPRDVLARLTEASELKAGWNDEDFERAERQLGELRIDLVTGQDDLKSDVYQGRRLSDEEFFKARNLDDRFQETEEILSDTRALTSHLISALNLSRHTKADQGAALLEAARSVGKALAHDPGAAKSQSNAICLASLPSHYDRPDWVVEMLADWTKWRLDEESVKELGRHLIEDEDGG